jgi:hypothetical protein
MHVHLPKALHNWRELAREIAIIVVGVFIALFFEQLGGAVAVGPENRRRGSWHGA